MSHRCAIIEDEPQARQLLAEYIGQLDCLELIFTVSDGVSGFNHLQQQPVDLLFLDINLPGITGLDLAAHLPGSTKVIFVTAYQEYALQGFEKNAIDYLLKPVSFQRFLQSVQKAQHLLQLEQLLPGSLQKSDPLFFAKSGKRIRQLDWEGVYYVEGLREYIALVTEKERILVYKRMKDLEALTLPGFLRIHKSYFVNLKKIRQVEDNFVYIHDTRLHISESYRDNFFEVLRSRLF
jgi:DNA-binding LytR/AlgR family response regulator